MITLVSVALAAGIGYCVGRERTFRRLGAPARAVVQVRGARRPVVLD